MTDGGGSPGRFEFEFTPFKNALHESRESNTNYNQSRSYPKLVSMLDLDLPHSPPWSRGAIRQRALRGAVPSPLAFSQPEYSSFNRCALRAHGFSMTRLHPEQRDDS